MLSGEATNTYLIVFGMTRLGIKYVGKTLINMKCTVGLFIFIGVNFRELTETEIFIYI